MLCFAALLIDTLALVWEDYTHESDHPAWRGCSFTEFLAKANGLASHPDDEGITPRLDGCPGFFGWSLA